MGDQPEFLLTAATATISALAAIVSIVYGRRAARSERLHEAEQLAVRFREPLLQAAYNLESRLYNIVRQDFLGHFLTGDSATEDERDYAVHNTVFQVAQYFAWVEIIRSESLYLDPKDVQRNRETARAMERVRDMFADSITYQDRTLRLFRGEQRALGEVMTVATQDPLPGAPRRECLGYAAYVAQRELPGHRTWLARLERDVRRLAGSADPTAGGRLTAIQHALLDLVAVLDPDGDRVPLDERQRI